MGYIGVITHMFQPLILNSWDIQVLRNFPWISAKLGFVDVYGDVLTDWDPMEFITIFHHHLGE